MTIHLVKRLIFVLMLALTLSGCDWVKKQYTWYQTKNLAHVLKWKIDNSRRLTMLEEVESRDWHDGIKVTHIQTNILDDYRECAYFDQDNWKCEGNDPDLMSVSMDKGSLTQVFYSQVRKYKPEYTVFDMPLYFKD